MTDQALAIALTDYVVGPIDRLMLALYAGASGDHTLIHVDDDAARSVGLPGAIGHGMLSMAIVGRALRHWFGMREMRSLAVRFLAPVHLGDVLTISARVAGTEHVAGHLACTLDLDVRATGDRKVLGGKAVVDIPADRVAASFAGQEG